VEGICGNQVFLEDQNDNGIFHKIGFGDLVIETLKKSNIEISQKTGETGVFIADYNISLLKGLLNFYYGNNAPKNASDNIDWLEPGPPPDVPEHEH